MHILISNIECCKPPFSFAFHRPEVRESIIAIKNPIRQRQTYLGDMMILRSFRNKIQYIDYMYNEYGKPALRFGTHLYFSKSHSHDYVITVTADHNVGIDIEKYSEKMMDLTSRFLNNEEMEQLATVENKERFLTDTWVIKESYSKLLGLGLYLDFRKIHIDYKKSAIKYNNRNLAYFVLRHLFEDYSVAICALEEIKAPINIQEFFLQE